MIQLSGYIDVGGKSPRRLSLIERFNIVFDKYLALPLLLASAVSFYRIGGVVGYVLLAVSIPAILFKCRKYFCTHTTNYFYRCTSLTTREFSDWENISSAVTDGCSVKRICRECGHESHLAKSVDVKV